MVTVSTTNVVARCADFQARVDNRTPGRVTGGFEGSRLGSAGWFAEAGQVVTVGIPSSTPAIGESYNVFATLQLYNNAPLSDVRCEATIPATTTGCQKIPIAAKVLIGLDSTGKPRCTLSQY